MKKYEYKRVLTEEILDEGFEWIVENLNALGEEGWELLPFPNDNGFFLFKREKNEEDYNVETNYKWVVTASYYGEKKELESEEAGLETFEEWIDGVYDYDSDVINQSGFFERIELWKVFKATNEKQLIQEKIITFDD